MHPTQFAQITPNKPAYIMAISGEIVTYQQLEERSNQGAHLLRSLGLNAGDTISILMDNSPRYFDVAWAAQRAGLYYTGISSKLNAKETAYIIKDSNSKMVVTTPSLADLADQLIDMLPDVNVFMVDGKVGKSESYNAQCAGLPVTPIDDQAAGTDMLYSSGTTGNPKGITPSLPDTAFDAPTPLAETLQKLFNLNEDTVYLSPAPLYHSSPLRWCMTINRLGGTAIIMEKFDASLALALIEKYRINCAQFVPTHFIRMLKVDDAVKAKYDVSSLQTIVHAAAPCPEKVKQAMIDWFGPVLHEFYAGTEFNGMTYIGPQDWLTHKGSVGPAVVGKLHICDEDGEPLPPGEEGLVYFENGPPFSYHNDPEKTAEAHNKYGWSTIGDVGKIDADGFLYLTDRKSFMIISGGVNIYPLEIENHLIGHPQIADVAVIGAPDEDMGEKVVAVVQLEEGIDGSDELAEEITRFARSGLSGVKTPRQVDFVESLPRHDTGKLYKRLIREQYWKDPK